MEFDETLRSIEGLLTIDKSNRFDESTSLHDARLLSPPIAIVSALAKELVETCRVKNGSTSPPFFTLDLSTQYDPAPRLVELHASSHCRLPRQFAYNGKKAGRSNSLLLFEAAKVCLR